MDRRPNRDPVFAIEAIMRGVQNALLISLFLLLIPVPGQAARRKAPATGEDLPRVYLDCRLCDRDYIQTEIPYVRYVRDRKDADFHILVTTQRTGGGGREFTVAYIGQGRFADMTDTLTYTAGPTDTWEETRQGLVRVLKLDLVRYLARSSLADQITVDVARVVPALPQRDPWNHWIFDINLGGSLRGERAIKATRFFVGLSVSRTTEAWKHRFYLFVDYSRDVFSLNGTSITSTLSNFRFAASTVRAIDDHWSIGAFTSAQSSTFLNTDLGFDAAPAVEYNIFPYSESTRRQLRISYRVGYQYFDYAEETIFDRRTESLLKQTLAVTLEVTQPWGSAAATLEGSNFFRSLREHRIRLFGNLRIRLFRGLSFRIFGQFSRIRDQIYLPKRGASLEEVLLLRKELATQYSYRISFGLNFTFGSIYRPVVNPRFGD